MNILWGQGADVERAVYQANDSYSWGLGVNVVKVTTTAGTVAPPNGMAVFSQLDNQGNPVPADMFVLKPSGEITFASTATLAGAGPDGKRGLKFITVGFIQNETSDTATHAQYLTGFDQYNEPTYKTRTFSTQGSTNMLDTVDTVNPPKPWYDRNNVLQTLTRPLNPIWTWSPPAGCLTADLSTVDFPWGIFPKYDGTASNNNIDAVYVDWSFTMYLAVATSESKNDSDKTFTQLRKVDWSIDYDGTFPAGAYTGAQNPAVSAPTLFSAPVTNGSVVPKTDGTIANVSANNGTWSPAT